MRTAFKPGDWVVFRVTKTSLDPGPRAVDVFPSPHGDTYSYAVDKFWAVDEVREHELLLITRRGKQHVVSLDDPRLRRARWWECWLYRHRFPIPKVVRQRRDTGQLPDKLRA